MNNALKRMDKTLRSFSPKKRLRVIFTSGYIHGVGRWGLEVWIRKNFEKWQKLLKKVDVFLVGCWSESYGATLFEVCEETGADAILEAVEIVEKGDVLVTGPVYKEPLYKRIREKGFDLEVGGVTEILKAYFKRKVEMVFSWFDGRRKYMPLFTRHIPLREVPSVVIDENRWREFFENLKSSYVFEGNREFLVLGLNPHASEGGKFGEEDMIVERILKKICAECGLNFRGVVPADTAFWRKASVYVSLYHDQWLPYLKGCHYASLVDETVGLDFYRFSPPSGPAVDIAKKIEAIFEAGDDFKGSFRSVQRVDQIFINPYDAILRRIFEVVGYNKKRK